MLGGISLYIWRDARRRAPKGHRLNAQIDAEGKRAGSKAQSEAAQAERGGEAPAQARPGAISAQTTREQPHPGTAGRDPVHATVHSSSLLTRSVRCGL